VNETEDATRRTRLANERTYLAWWRSGLTSFAVSLGAGKLVPAVSSGATWPFEVVGVGFAALGVVACAYGYVRQRAVERALDRGEFDALSEEAALALAAAAVALGVATALLVLFA
jgi:putative membrane protein